MFKANLHTFYICFLCLLFSSKTDVSYAIGPFHYNLLTINESPKKTWINWITINDSLLAVNMSANNMINDSLFASWINIDPNTFIYEHGKQLKLLRAEGIAVAPSITQFDNPNQTITFSLKFPHVNDLKESINLIENDSSDWKFIGIQFHQPFSNNSTNIYYAPHIYAQKIYSYSDSLMQIGDFESAIEVNTHVLTYINTNNIKADNLLSTVAYCLAGCYNTLKNDSSTIYFSNLVIKLYKSNQWKEDIPLARMYGVLADAYARKENYSQAIRYGEEALRIKTIIYPNGSLDLALTYNKLSFYYTASGDLDNATRCAEREHHIREQLEKSDLKKDYQFSIANKEIEDKCNELHSLSWSYFEKNNYEKAIELGENILELWNKSSLPHNREYTNYVNFLSLYYAANNELETAISTALSVKDFMESIDHEDPDYLAYVSSISRWYAELSNYTESELWARHALETINDINSVNYYDHALALNTLAKCNQQMGHYGEAIDHYLEVITILQNDTTTNLDLMSSSLYGLSCCYGSIAKYEDAIQYGELALKIRNKGKSLIPYANQLLEMSRYYKEIHNYQMALDYVDKASTIYKNEDNDSTSYLIALRSKAWIYYELGDDSLAFTILEEAYDIGRTMLGDDAPRISSFVVDYAQTLILKHDYNKGIEL